MKGLKIWQRYFLKQFLQVFFLFLFSFYGLYVLIDYANHTSPLPSHSLQIAWTEIARYYLFVFASRAEILLPLALLVAFVKTVTGLNIHHELMALMASGISLKTLMRPFLSVGLCCVALLYANEQFLLPQAMKKLKRIEEERKNKKSRQQREVAAQSLILADKSLLIFQHYEATQERFFDVYWIPSLPSRSIDKIYRMKFLAPSLDPPMGFFVDELVRQEGGEILQAASYRAYPFPRLKFNPQVLQSTLLDPDMFSLLELRKEMAQISSLPNEKTNEKESKTQAAFYWKLSLPWLCLLTILASAPYCVRFSRQLPLFLLYICSLFGLLAFYLWMDAAQVIAKRQVLSPLVAIFLPFMSLLTYFSWRFAKIDSY